MTSRSLLVLLTSVLSGSVAFAADDYSATGKNSGARYTFSWSLGGSAPKPRGGTTKGPAVELDKSDSAAWKALQEPGLTTLERDRRAILAMAGTYRVTFDFLEITPFAGQGAAPTPYQSWGTEKIYVDSDSGRSISLVHILEMRVLMDDGSVSEPMVTKHWRQDWTYEPTHIVEYQGREHWVRRKLDAATTKGAWLQSVYQVDESPRYAGVGRWEHKHVFSTWLSGDTWRPLPRREWSVRDDYQALVGTNRHTVITTGWVQEENNLKAVVPVAGKLDEQRPYVAREYGVARYERLRDADFAGADRYFERTKQFWDQVRNEWATLFATQGEVTLKGPVDKLGLYRPLFAQAERLESGEAEASAETPTVIRNALKSMGAVRD
jgi:hypothetical protein